MKVSNEAMTPIWLQKRDYKKLKIDVEFKSDKPDFLELEKLYNRFCFHESFGNNEQLVNEAHKLHESAFYDADENEKLRS